MKALLQCKRFSLAIMAVLSVDGCNKRLVGSGGYSSVTKKSSCVDDDDLTV